MRAASVVQLKNSCVSLAGRVLCFIACFILLVIAPLLPRVWTRRQLEKLEVEQVTEVMYQPRLLSSGVVKRGGWGAVRHLPRDGTRTAKINKWRTSYIYSFIIYYHHHYCHSELYWTELYCSVSELLFSASHADWSWCFPCTFINSFLFQVELQYENRQIVPRLTPSPLVAHSEFGINRIFGKISLRARRRWRNHDACSFCYNTRVWQTDRQTDRRTDNRWLPALA